MDLVDGRGGEIRTHDPLYPKQVRYQTAPRPDDKSKYLLNMFRRFEKRKIFSRVIYLGFDPDPDGG